MSIHGYRISRKIHLIIGLFGALWLIFVSVTGILINHQDALGLADKQINNRYLPPGYRTDARAETTRLNVVILDLHSGRFFGRYGYLIGDFIALLLVLSVVSGIYIHLFCNQVKTGTIDSGSPRSRFKRSIATEAKDLAQSGDEIQKNEGVRILANRN